MKETGIKTKFILRLLFAVLAFAGLTLSAAEEPVQYQGVRVSDGETEAALPSLVPADKCCDRQVNARRDRSPHGLSPLEVHNLVQRTLSPGRTPRRPPPADESQTGSR